MASTAYRVAATPSSPKEKVITNLKSARREADARARLDRVDVEVRTVATGKLTYTAQGAPAPVAPAEDDAPVAAAPAEGDAPAADEQPEGDAPAADAQPEGDSADDTPAADEDDEAGDDIDMSGFEAALAEVVSGDQDAPDTDTDAPAPADADSDAQDDQEPAPADTKDHRGQADCGCSVEAIIATGEHQKGCADAPKAKAAAEAVERDKPVRPATTRKGGGGRRESQGPSVVDGWELLYDKPQQQAQVGRNAQGKYALICTTHKHAHPLTRLVQERGLRGGKRSVWCPECTGK